MLSLVEMFSNLNSLSRVWSCNMLFGGVSGSLDGVVKYSVVGKEAYCGLNTVTKIIDVD